MLENYLYHLSINEMKVLRKLATKYIAQKKREGFGDDDGEIS